MNVVIGCVLAVRDRPAEILERTLQTYAYQTLRPADKVLLDYGSGPEFARQYQALCGRFGWRRVPCPPEAPRWHLSAAYNAAVAALAPEVDVVFKGDVDVLLGRDVLETAAVLGRDRLCVFSCMAAAEGTAYPREIAAQGDLVELLRSPDPPQAMPTEGFHAYPRGWFERIGGFDLSFRGWGFEDSDLRERAKWSIGVVYVTTCLLVHQWHPSARSPEEVAQNQAHYRKMAAARQLVRNGGNLSGSPKNDSQDHASPGAPATAGGSARPSVAVATRSMNEHLYRESGRCLGSGRQAAGPASSWPRRRITGADALGYFRELASIDADWVVNLDEDAFLLDPGGLPALIRRMEEGGYAACGMPDGGVVPIRRHNPAACNAFFNVFDLRRVRAAWRDWGRVAAARHRPEYEGRVAEFARRSAFAFDHFERYYGAFFALLEAGERVLYLDAEEWRDGVSTLLKDATGAPLLIHCWYSRHWDSSHHTRRRYERVIDYALKAQGVEP